MSAVTKTVHLYAKAPRFGADIEYWVSEFGSLSLKDFGRVAASAEVTFEIPADMNPVAMAIEELEAEKAEVGRQFRATMQRINDRLSRLQAITNEVPA